MTLPTVTEITPQLEAVTPDTFIDRWAAVAHAGTDPARDQTLAADREATAIQARRHADEPPPRAPEPSSHALRDLCAGRPRAAQIIQHA